MPEIQAFRGLRYNLAMVGALSDCIAPPYDVVASDLQDHLYNLSPYNFLRLELNKVEPSDDDSNNVYTRAARIFRTWRNEGILQIEPDPAIYVYHQEFDYRGHTFIRKGVMTRVRLKRFGEGNIYPHEETHAKAKDDRLKLTRTTQANLSQIFGLYPDPENEVQAILESEISGVHGLEATDHLGVVHKVWPITDINVIAQVSGLVSPKDMFIADGHHRYETACNYRDELAAKGDLPSDHPANFVLTMLVGMNDPGLLVLPTHRLLGGVPEMTTAELHEKLSPYFDCDVVAKGAESAGSVWAELERLDEQQIMALYSKASNEWTRLTCKPEAMERMESLAPNQSEDWRGLGVAILHKLILDDLLGLEGHPVPTYVHFVQEVIDGLNGKLVSQSGYPLAALVMPATVDNIRDVSIHQERMPAKSTYFFPKLVSGLVVHPLS
ncbi:MAG: DUF1015 domain-containing protein [Planctomycetota bacterium]|nr:DUF1015 domain-containing protein [Planctomycetota bacterium]